MMPSQNPLKYKNADNFHVHDHTGNGKTYYRQRRESSIENSEPNQTSMQEMEADECQAWQQMQGFLFLEQTVFGIYGSLLEQKKVW